MDNVEFTPFVRNDGEDHRHAATLPLSHALRSPFALPESASGVRNGCGPPYSIRRMKRAAASDGTG